jgi:hypothetical protein
VEKEDFSEKKEAEKRKKRRSGMPDNIFLYKIFFMLENQIICESHQ